MICWALAWRSACGLSVIERRPLLSVGFVPSAPMNDATVATSGSCADDVGDRLLALDHGGERDVGRRLGDAEEQARVLLREEALRHDERERRP